MSKKDVGRALSAMDDETTRRRLAEGDFSVLEPIELTNEERGLIKNAASDYPEVAGFSFDNWMNSGMQASKAAPKKVALESADYQIKVAPTKYDIAARWASGK
jgi:hypothetical protein